MKVTYFVKRTINTGNYENVVITYGVEAETGSADTATQTKDTIEKLVENWTADKEKEVRGLFTYA